ncbi:MAG: ankyrin repeat domain-containing protein [Bacteroidota bacterium]
MQERSLLEVFEGLTNGDYELLVRYLEAGGDPDARDSYGHTLLHLAVHEGLVDSIRILLRSGANVEEEDDFGNTPMQVACMIGRREVANLLLEYGAKIDSTSSTRTWTPLMLALNKSHEEVAEWLIKEGANPNHVDQEQGWTPLLVACDQGMKELSIKLIREGGQVDAKVKSGDAQGCSAIHLVSYYGTVEVIDELIRRGVDINLRPEGGGLGSLHWAVYNGHMELLTYLLGKGADANLPAPGLYQSRSPLHFAVANSRPEMARLLLDFDADPLYKDDEDQSPLDIALRRFKESGSQKDQYLLQLLEAYV